MQIAHLKKKGWSTKEVKQLRRILSNAEKQQTMTHKIVHHFTFWLLLSVLACVALGFVLILLPFLALSNYGFAIPTLFLLAVCLGLLLVHSVRELRLEGKHQHLGVGVFFLVSITATFVVLRIFQDPIGLPAFAPLLYTLTLVCGVLLPYVVHWRIEHGSH